MVNLIMLLLNENGCIISPKILVLNPTSFQASVPTNENTNKTNTGKPRRRICTANRCDCYLKNLTLPCTTLIVLLSTRFSYLSVEKNLERKNLTR